MRRASQSEAVRGGGPAQAATAAPATTHRAADHRAPAAAGRVPRHRSPLRRLVQNVTGTPPGDPATVRTQPSQPLVTSPPSLRPRCHEWRPRSLRPSRVILLGQPSAAGRPPARPRRCIFEAGAARVNTRKSIRDSAYALSCGPAGPRYAAGCRIGGLIKKNSPASRGEPSGGRTLRRVREGCQKRNRSAGMRPKSNLSASTIGARAPSRRRTLSGSCA